MSLTSPDAKAVVAAVDRLTTQVRRLADGMSTAQQQPTDAVSTTADDAVKTFPPIPRPTELFEDERPLREHLAAADEDEQRTTRRASLRNLLDRLDRSTVHTWDEGYLLRQHVEAEMRDADTMRAAEQRADDFRTARDQAQAAIDRVRALADEYATSDERWRPSARLTGQVFRRALDGGEQPTTTKEN